MKILIINGPNLNMLGERDESVYGADTLASINSEITSYCKGENINVEFFQSNIEGEIVGAVQQAKKTYGAEGLVINAGAYTHYSHAIGDALGCIKMPKVEVHMSNVHAREDFRRVSVLSDNCNGMICGFGADSYKLACLAVKNILGKAK